METMQMTQLQTAPSLDNSVQETIEGAINDLMASLPKVDDLTSAERRGIIARYTSVLEGNFIYWMTATLLAVKADEARPIILENLHEEVRDAHPAMMRRFAIAADAYPTNTDALEVNDDLTRMRVFLGKLSGVQSLASMAFFEGFIQRFMPYLASLAVAEGSTEMEYTDVHGVCDIAHTAGLFEALRIERQLNSVDENEDILEGVWLLRTLMENVIGIQTANRFN